MPMDVCGKAQATTLYKLCISDSDRTVPDALRPGVRARINRALSCVFQDVANCSHEGRCLTIRIVVVMHPEHHVLPNKIWPSQIMSITASSFFLQNKHANIKCLCLKKFSAPDHAYVEQVRSFPKQRRFFASTELGISPSSWYYLNTADST